ncbi:hypothetical protein K7X08_027586 [Anisodus acutangulus]|uniref:Uncharacterized protein n=1 Tax=Anisodus acutangulus TaxID=402998 RepID=A0A9Q1MMF1_9SOLA|nr:hypothetical protein K7X08_027586 [Anisodus acutangulus]
MEESEKRKERLKAMRMEASQSGDYNGSSNLVNGGLTNPLIDSSIGQVESYAMQRPRFDYYTDPMAAFSANKRSNNVSPQVSQQCYTPPPRPRNPQYPQSPSNTARGNYPVEQRPQSQGVHHTFNPLGNPGQNSPFGTPQRSSANARGSPYGTPNNYVPPNSSPVSNFASPGIHQGGRPGFHYGQGSGQQDYPESTGSTEIVLTSSRLPPLYSCPVGYKGDEELPLYWQTFELRDLPFLRMFEKSKKHKCFVSEEDISILLQRYPATTMLAVLQEVVQVADEKIVWDALVRKSTTGIANAREYQMLWRHLAYRHSLNDKLDDGAQPLDDDSDLEYELEAFPAVSSEASAVAAACVKVLIASGVPNDANMLNGSTVETPLTINIPNGQSSRSGMDNSLQGTSMHGTNITVPVAVQKQPLSTVAAAEGFDTNRPACTNVPPRRKRKPWSAAEDLELIAVVQKCGEGNWANILKGDFKGDRTASQLSQRWAIIRKRKGTMVGSDSQLSEAQLAACRAISLALNMPIGAGVGPNSGAGPSNSSHPVASDFASGGAQSKHQQDLLSSKPWVGPQNPAPNPTTSPDPMVKVAAVAAGARIATPSNSASLLKAGQPKTALQIPPAVKSSVPGSTNGLPSNVHFIRTGLVSHSAGPSKAARPGTQQVLVHSLKPASLTVQHKPAGNSSRPNASVEPNARTCATAAKLEVNTKQEVLQKVQQDQTPPSANSLIEKADELKENKKEDRDPVHVNALGIQVQKKLSNLPSREIASNEKIDPSNAPARTENESADGGDPSKEPAELRMGKNKME